MSDTFIWSVIITSSVIVVGSRITPRPDPKLVERYVKGEYGQKTGKGWYDYTK